MRLVPVIGGTLAQRRATWMTPPFDIAFTTTALKCALRANISYRPALSASPSVTTTLRATPNVRPALAGKIDIEAP